MPKKFKGTNSKAEEARARKEAVKTAEKERKQREEEDKYWEDNDKHVQRKQQRKEDKDRKRLETAERKAANQEALKAEESTIKQTASVRTKKTVAEIQAEREKKAAAAAAAAAAASAEAKSSKVEEEETEENLEENPNRKMAELMAAEGAVEARSVEDAIAVLNVGGTPVDRHPEKRMKAAYNAFEERELPRLKQENPNMRLSQLKQLLKKDWMKSPENPMNMAYAAKRT